MSHEQQDLFGGTVPLEQLQLTGNLRLLADAEHDLGAQLTADEAGAILHEHRGKHGRDARCHFCGEDGLEALTRLRAKTPAPKIATVNECFLHGPHDGDRCPHPDHQRNAPKTPPWTCVDCEHENPPGAIFCRGCASTQDDDPEPRLTGLQPREGAL